MFVDCLQYIAPSEKIFRQMRAGQLDVVHLTVGYHEDFDGVVENLQRWRVLIDAHTDLIAWATSIKDIEAAQKAGKTALLFGLQNPLPIGTDLRKIETLLRLGIRFCQITYNQQSLLGAGCFEPVDSGLTAFGREAIAEMNRLGMVVDLSHAGHKSAMDAVAFSTRPITVTHANPHAWHAAPRNLQHELIQALSDTGGMIGFSLYPHHLNDGSNCQLQDFADMAQNMMQTYGANMFGIGSDLCQDQPDEVVNWMRNGFWKKVPAAPVAFPEQPIWFRDNRDFPKLAQGLTKAGMNEKFVAGLMGDNWMKFLEKAFEPG